MKEERILTTIGYPFFFFNLFIYSNCILYPYGSSNYNTKACKYIKEKQHKHNKYVNVGDIFDWRGLSSLVIVL